MKVSKGKIIVATAVAVVLIVAFFGLRGYIFSRIQDQIDDAVAGLNNSGYRAGYENLAIHWGRNIIEVSGVFVEKPSLDTTCTEAEFIRAHALRAEGFELLPLVFQDLLSFESFLVDSLSISIRDNLSLSPPDSTEQERDDFALRIANISIAPMVFVLSDSINCKTVARILTAAHVDDLKIELPANGSLAYSLDQLVIDESEVNLPKDLYTVKVQHARWDLLKDIFRIDSMEVIPLEPKVAFGLKRGMEIDRFDGVIPYFEAKDFSVGFIDTAFIKASQVDIQFYLNIFRDKRRPFVKKKKLLPVEQLQDLPFALFLDSLKVRKSYVKYEEFAEEATEAGMVYFDDLYASIYNIDNRADSGDTRLSARANLLGHGQIDIRVNFPLQENMRSSLTGTIANFKLPEINAMLVPSTNIKVESGHMKRLSFKFRFNEVRSDGEIELNYDDLKLSVFKEVSPKRGEKPDKDNLKTFIMNTFIFRSEMDEKVPEEKRTGTVAYVRDNNRSIFNFWVKSLLSGVKSAYNLDKLEARQSERQLKKEERLTRREARRLKRAQKKEQG